MERKENKVRFCEFSEVLADWKWLLTYSRRCKKMIALYIALGVLGTTVGLFGSVAGKYLIDIVTGYDTARLPLLVFAAIGSTAVSIAFDCVVSRVLKKLEIDLNNNVRADVFDRILDADWQALHAFSCGDILNRFETDTGAVGGGAVSWLPQILVTAYRLCAVFFLCYLGRVIKEPRRLLYIGCAVLVFAVLSASFLFPMLEQMASGTFLSTDGTSATYYGTLTQRSLPWWASVFDFNTRLDYKTAAFGFWIPNGLGMSFFVMLAAFVRYITRIDDKKNLFVFLYFSVFLLLMTTELFPWSYFQSLCGTMQFPWRLLLFATFFMALFAGQFIRQAPTKNASAVFCTLFVCCSLFSYVSTASVSILNYANYAANGTEITYNYKDNIGAGEYLPSSDLNPPSYRSFLYNRRDRVTTNNASLGTLKAERGHGSVSVAFSGNNEVDTYIDVPLLMYKGYAARVTLEKDGSEVELPVGYGENNLVRVHLQGVAAGTVTVWYEGTAVQKVSFVVTAVGFGLLLAGGCAYAVLRRRRSGGTPAGGQASQPAISSETVTKE